MPYPSFGFLDFQFINISTIGPGNVSDTEASVDGSLDSFSSRSGDVDVFAEYREEGTSTWSQSSTRSLSSTGPFSIDISGLSGDTTYEFRVISVVQDPVRDTGDIDTFTTEPLGTPDISLAMRLSRSHDDNDTREIEAPSNVTVSRAQMLDRRAHGNQV